jgi:hypothetical protein
VLPSEYELVVTYYGSDTTVTTHAPGTGDEFVETPADTVLRIQTPVDTRRLTREERQNLQKLRNNIKQSFV